MAHRLPPDDRRCTARSKSSMRRRSGTYNDQDLEMARRALDRPDLSLEDIEEEHESILFHWEMIDDRCPMWAIRGGKVCYHHGGANQDVIARAQTRVRTREIEAYAGKVLAQEGLETVEDPLQELSKMATQSKALMDALGARVNSLQELEHFDAKNSPTIKAEVQMYERAMDRTARLLEALVKAGYTERQIKIQETEALMIAGVIKRTIAALGLTPEQQTRAQSILAQEFRALAPRPVPGRNS